ncbi:MAG: YdeI/OmpD-associated family protein [Anaerolineae bacterium]|nr:YdeI/OmpD-associated family protein [Anaerolineae bacterium]
MDELPVILFESVQAWEAWLEEHHQTAPGVKLKIAKKASGQESVSYAEALDVALCFGWIDSRKDKFDDSYWLQRFTPRRKKSPWSAINRKKIDALIAEGRMREAGLREVEQAKQDGRWDVAYQPPSRATVPDDLQQALDQNDAAREFFATLNSTNRYAIIYRVNSVKKPETRQKRIAQFIDMLAQNKKLYD